MSGTTGTAAQSAQVKASYPKKKRPRPWSSQNKKTKKR